MGLKTKAGHALLIREAKLTDAEAMLSIARVVLQEGFGVSTPEEFHDDIDKEREWISHYIDRDGNHDRLFVAECEGAVVGFINFDCANKDKLRHQGSFGMSVHADWRGQGVGKALLVTLLDYGATNPAIDTVRLDVLASNERAIALYEKLGFEHEGRRVRYVKTAEGYEDLLLMAKHV